MANHLVIYKQMGSPFNAKPFRIADVFSTVDGMRTRLSHQCFGSMEEAEAYIETQKKAGHCG